MIYIENGSNYHTYTFRIDRENAPANAPLENLVLTPLPDGHYKELLVSYNLTAQEKQNLLQGNHVDTQDKITITELANGTFTGNRQLNKGLSCGWVPTVSFTWCSKDQHNNGEQDPVCKADVTSQMIIGALYKCTYLGDQGGDIGNGGGTGEAPAEECVPATYTTPVDPTLDFTDNPCFIGVPTTPNTGGNQQDPCEQLNNIKGKPGFTNKMTELKNNIPTGTQEKGFAIRDIPNQPFSHVVQGGGGADGGVSYPFKDTTPRI